MREKMSNQCSTQPGWTMACVACPPQLTSACVKDRSLEANSLIDIFLTVVFHVRTGFC